MALVNHRISSVKLPQIAIQTSATQFHSFPVSLNNSSNMIVFELIGKNFTLSDSVVLVWTFNVDNVNGTASIRGTPSQTIIQQFGTYTFTATTTGANLLLWVSDSYGPENVGFTIVIRHTWYE
jgi:hypothetical protein